MSLFGRIGIINIIVFALIVLVTVGFILLHKTEVETPEKVTEQLARKVLKEKSEILIEQLQQAFKEQNTKQVSSLIRDTSREGPAAIPFLMSSFKESNQPEFQMIIVKTMGTIPHQTTVEALKKLYSEYINEQSNSDVRKEMILALSRIDGRNNFETFVTYLKEEKHPPLRKVLCDCLVATGDIPKIDSVIKANQDNQSLIQDLTAVKNTLAKKETERDETVEIKQLDLSAPEGIDKLENILKSDRPLGLRLLALQKLEKANSAEAVKVLMAYLESFQGTNDNDKIVKLNVLVTLTRLRINEARLLVKKLLKNEDGEIRRQTVEFLGGFGDEASIPLLNQVVSNDLSSEVQQKARQSIQKIKERNK